MSTTLWHSKTRWTAVTEMDDDLKWGIGVVWTVFDENNVRVGGLVGSEEIALNILRTQNHGEPLS